MIGDAVGAGGFARCVCRSRRFAEVEESEMRIVGRSKESVYLRLSVSSSHLEYRLKFGSVCVFRCPRVSICCFWWRSRLDRSRIGICGLG